MVYGEKMHNCKKFWKALEAHPPASFVLPMVRSCGLWSRGTTSGSMSRSTSGIVILPPLVQPGGCKKKKFN